MLGTTASADFCRLSRTLRCGFSSLTSSSRSPRVRTLTFPSCRRRIYVRNPWSYRTLPCLASSSGCARLMRFVFLGARVCRRLPSDLASRRAPLPLASGCHDQAPQRTLTSKSTPMPGARERGPRRAAPFFWSTGIGLSAPRCLRRLALTEQCDDALVELRDIVRLSAGDEPFVFDDWFVSP